MGLEPVVEDTPLTVIDLPIGLPPDWVPVAVADPEDTVWKLACIDWLEENGHTLASEGLRWAVEKGRVPFKSNDSWLTTRNRSIKPEAAIPVEMLHRTSDLWERFKLNPAFSRLIVAWQLATDLERQEWWKWLPTERSDG